MDPNPWAAAEIADPIKTAATKRPLDKKRLIIIVTSPLPSGPTDCFVGNQSIRLRLWLAKAL
jgi:hypothetical protein